MTQLRTGLRGGLRLLVAVGRRSDRAPPGPRWTSARPLPTAYPEALRYPHPTQPALQRPSTKTGGWSVHPDRKKES
jgi:hypothetical protein